MTRRALLVHGLSSSSASWWRVRHALESEGWSVRTVDLLGHGANPAAAGYRLADYTADLPRGTWDLVIGHSLGGAVAVLAAQEPGFTRSLVLLDPVLEVPEADFEATLADQVSELSLDEASLAAAKPHWHERDRAAKLEGVRGVDPAAVERTFTDNRPWDLVAEARALTVPTLILAGDPTVYTMLDPATARSLPGVDYRVVPGAGHSPHRDEPEATIAALRDWLSR